jgi:putative methyltransferase
MSLYYAAAEALANPKQQGGSLKSRIYGRTSSAQNSPAQIYALITETAKWSRITKEVIERSELLQLEKKASLPKRQKFILTIFSSTQPSLRAWCMISW